MKFFLLNEYSTQLNTINDHKIRLLKMKIHFQLKLIKLLVLLIPESYTLNGKFLLSLICIKKVKKFKYFNIFYINVNIRT